MSWTIEAGGWNFSRFIQPTTCLPACDHNDLWGCGKLNSQINVFPFGRLAIH